MPPRITDERILIDGASLRIHVRATEPVLAAELRGADDHPVKAAPALGLAGEFAATLDLSGLGDGHYSVAVRTPGGSSVVGHAIARRTLAIAGSHPTPGALKLGTASIVRRDGPAHVCCYVEPVRGEVLVRVSATDDIDSFLAGLIDRPKPKAAARPKAADRKRADRDPGIRFSVVSAVYNVDKYIDDFFRSMVEQTLDFRSHIELIMVDDGSTDRSAKTIKRWQRKYPANIRYVHKENGGVSSARNRGLDDVSHEWLTFADPDDFVDRDYFRAVADAIKRLGAANLALVSCNLIFYIEAQSATADEHPLRYRFANGEKLMPSGDLGRYIQTGSNTAFFRRDRIAAARLGFDGRVRPMFEDAHFVGRYLASLPESQVAFLPQAKYFYRKRGDQSSLVDRSRIDPNWYGDQLKFGCLGLLRETAGPNGMPPKHVQNTVLYELSWRFQYIVDRPHTVAFLGEERRRRFAALLTEIFSLIDTDTIMNFDLSYLPFAFRVGILALFKNKPPPRQIVEVGGIDERQGLVKLVYWSREAEPTATFLVDGRPVQSKYAKLRRRDFLGAAFVWEHIVWLPAEGKERLAVRFPAGPASLRVKRRDFDQGIAVAAVGPALRELPANLEQAPEKVVRVRAAARTPAAMDMFRNAWVFMDRDNEADDSAEHLYRHVRKQVPGANAFFVLSRTAPQWQRLADDGFRLLPFNEPEHALALLNADLLISSQADHYVVDYLEEKYFGDLTKYRFVFLQHGVIKDDLSGWLNGIKIDCLITTTRAEYDSIVADGSGYRLTAREVALTGLPRHDALLAAPRSGRRWLVVMPTWRESLTGIGDSAGHERPVSPAFQRSEFARRWRDLLHSPRLLDAATAAGRSVLFVPHPHLEPHIAHLCPPGIEVRRFSDRDSIQPVFADLDLLVTDFSSKAFDAALLGRPVIYYQFDREDFFGGEHAGAPGYFDYERDGFGPVVGDHEALLDLIEARLKGTEPDSVYRERADATFQFRDGKCCERVLEAIRALAEA